MAGDYSIFERGSYQNLMTEKFLGLAPIKCYQNRTPNMMMRTGMTPNGVSVVTNSQGGILCLYLWMVAREFPLDWPELRKP